MTHPESSEDLIAVMVQLETTLELEIFTPQAVDLSDDAIARNLEPGTEYLPLTDSEFSAYLEGGVKVVPESRKFSLVFPSLDVMKTSITAVKG